MRETKEINKIKTNQNSVGARTARPILGILTPSKGITLLALVITIVLMLILAGVTVNVAINGGLFEYAGKAKYTTENASEKEAIQTAVIIAKGQSKTGRITVEEMQKALNKVINEGTATAINNGDTIAIKFEQSGRYYNVDSNGKIEQFTPYFDTTPGVLAQNDGVYMIESIEDLVVFSAMTNGGYSDNYVEIGTFPQYSSPSVVLMCDLDFKSSLSYDDYTTTIYNGYLGIEDEDVSLMEALTNTEEYKGFIPIGCESSKFSGTFDGKKHVIQNLSENVDNYAGLFGYITATVKNVTVTGNIKSAGYAGGIVGSLASNLFTNKVDGPKIINCINYAEVSGSSAGGIIGLLGYGYSTLSDCINYGIVSSSTSSGGIVGYMDSSYSDIKYCVNSGEVLGNNAGGIIGQQKVGQSYIYSCCSTARSQVKTLPDSGRAGGIMGFAYGPTTIYNSFNLGSVTAKTNARTVLLEKILVTTIRH